MKTPKPVTITSDGRVYYHPPEWKDTPDGPSRQARINGIIKMVEIIAKHEAQKADAA